MIYKPKFLFLIVGLFILTVALINSSKSGLTSLDRALELSLGNSGELKKSIEHFEDDSAKVMAMKFLISGMPGMVNYDSNYLTKFKTVVLRSKEVVNALEATGLPWWTQLRFQYYDSMAKVVSDWEKETGIKGPGISKNDLEVITSQYLINNVDLAFEAREKYPWTRKLSLNDFNEYVLPYAFGQGPLDTWRSRLGQKYQKYLEATNYNPDSLKQAINRILYSMGHMHYTTSLNPYINYLNAEQILSAKGSTCSAKAKVNIQVLRALGVPITTDFYQFPANESSTPHQWNVIADGDSTWSFDPYWQNLDEFWINGKGEKHIHNNKYRTFETMRVSKIFRTVYSIQRDLVELFEESKGDVPPFFKNLKMIDVSEKYLNVGNVDAVVKDVKFAYISNLTLNYKWEPVAWTKVDADEHARFKNLGKDVAYMVASYQKGIPTPLSEPFILHEDGTIQWTTSQGDTTTLVLDELRFEHNEDNHGKKTKLKDIKSKYFELFRWVGNEWASVGKQELVGDKLIYHGIPRSGMYLLKNRIGGGKERIFTYDHGKQNWW